MSVKILNEDIKSGCFRPLYYIYGEEEYLKEFYYSELKTKSVTELAEFNVVEFESKSFDYLDFTNCVNSYPVMADRKFVGVTDLENSLIKGNFAKSFTAFLKTVPEFCTVVFVDTELKSFSGANALEKAVREAGGVLVKVERPTGSVLVNWVARHFKKAGKVISANDINYMLGIAENDMRSLSNEISKLCSYVSSDTVTKDDIDAVVTKSVEANRYEITEAFCSGNYTKVLDIIDKMYKQNIDDILIVNSLYYAFADLWKARTALDAGKTSADMARDFGGNPYILAKVMKSARSLSAAYLDECLAAARQLDLKLKSLPVNKRDLIVTFVGEVVGRRDKFAKA